MTRKLAKKFRIVVNTEPGPPDADGDRWYFARLWYGPGAKSYVEAASVRSARDAVNFAWDVYEREHGAKGDGDD